MTTISMYCEIWKDDDYFFVKYYSDPTRLYKYHKERDIDAIYNIVAKSLNIQKH